MPTPYRQQQLGDFLRSRRKRLDPAAVGLAIRHRRRTPGLRREEVAEIAGISADWVARLEQGRAVRPSPATVDALAHALRLGETDRAHLLALALERPDAAPEHVPDAVRRLVDGLAQPAYITGRRLDVLAWNADAAAALVDFDRLSAPERNVLRYMVLDPEARRLFGPAWEDEARRVVALFRAAYDVWADDPAFAALEAELQRESDDFARWWQDHDVRGVAASEKTLFGPDREQRYEVASLRPADAPGLTLVVYTPV